MSLDKFGRSAAPHTTSHLSTLQQLQRGFTFTKDENIDIRNVNLCNVQLPTEDEDASTKGYVDLIKGNLFKKPSTLHEELGAVRETVEDINDQVNRSMNRIQELDQFINLVILDDPRTLNDLVRETGERLGQLSTTWDERFKNIEQFKTKTNFEIEEVKRVVSLM